MTLQLAPLPAGSSDGACFSVTPSAKCFRLSHHQSSTTGWWFGCHFLFSHILGMSSSQLTFIFFRGVAQPPTRIRPKFYPFHPHGLELIGSSVSPLCFCQSCSASKIAISFPPLVLGDLRHHLLDKSCEGQRQ